MGNLQACKSQLWGKERKLPFQSCSTKATLQSPSSPPATRYASRACSLLPLFLGEEMLVSLLQCCTQSFIQQRSAYWVFYCPTPLPHQHTLPLFPLPSISLKWANMKGNSYTEGGRKHAPRCTLSSNSLCHGSLCS